MEAINNTHQSFNDFNDLYANSKPCEGSCHVALFNIYRMAMIFNLAADGVNLAVDIATYSAKRSLGVIVVSTAFTTLALSRPSLP